MVGRGGRVLSEMKAAKLKQAERHPTVEDDVTIYRIDCARGETVLGARSTIGVMFFWWSSFPATPRFYEETNYTLCKSDRVCGTTTSVSLGDLSRYMRIRRGVTRANGDAAVLD